MYNMYNTGCGGNMFYIGLGCLVLFIAFVVLDAKNTRHDGIYIKETHPYRKIMPFVMKGRNESIVYLDIAIPSDNLMHALKEREHLGITQCVVVAISRILHTHTHLNRFVSGGRLYQRNEVVISFSMKRKKLGTDAKIAIVRQVTQAKETFADICSNIDKQINRERSSTKTYADKEYGILSMLPRFALRLGVWLVRLLDDYNILPASFIQNDGLYCSAFVANVGSLKMSPGYHHLYEWGNCPIFITVGAIEERIVAKDGVPHVQNTLPMRIAFDERINDALGVRKAVESIKEFLLHPQTHLWEEKEHT